MLAKLSAAFVTSLILVTASHPAQANEDAPFRFSFSRSELTDPQHMSALETRLQEQASRYCRSVAREGRSPVSRWGCRRSVVEATRAALARVRAETA
jgi:UrcA family protein